MKYNHMKTSIMAAVLLAGAAFTTHTYAGSLDFGLDSEFSGTFFPGPTVPWLSASFVDTAPNTVQLTLSATSLYPTAYVSEWDFNFNPAANLSALTITPTIGGVGIVAAPTITKSTDSILLDTTGGDADIQMKFLNNDFTAGESIVFNITGIAGLNSSFFNYASVNSTTGPWYTAAQAVVPCPTCGGFSLAWIGDCTSTPNNTPEPATMAILGSFIAFGVYLKRRNGQSVKA